MNLYNKVCYKVEDVFVKMLTTKQDELVVKEKVSQYRLSKENSKDINK